VQKMPRYLIPKYFDKVVMKLYLSGIHYIVSDLMGHSKATFKPTMNEFLSRLILTSVQFVGSFPNYPLITPELIAVTSLDIFDSLLKYFAFFSFAFSFFLSPLS
jgi:hypothetical protein